MSMPLPCARCWLAGCRHRPPSLRLRLLSRRSVSWGGTALPRHLWGKGFSRRRRRPCRCKAEGSLLCMAATWIATWDLLAHPLTVVVLWGVLPRHDPMRKAAAAHLIACQCGLAGSKLPWSSAPRLMALIQMAGARLCRKTVKGFARLGMRLREGVLPPHLRSGYFHRRLIAALRLGCKACKDTLRLWLPIVGGRALLVPQELVRYCGLMVTSRAGCHAFQLVLRLPLLLSRIV